MLGWFRNRFSGGKQRYPSKDLAPVEEIAEQGVLVADVAIRLGVKNAIIMNALAKHVDYSVDDVCDLVRGSIAELVDEREADAARIDDLLTNIRRFGHAGWAEGDYSRDDRPTLEHRQAVYRLVASELRTRQDDEAYVSSMAERARKEAWSEIGDSLKTKAEHPYYGGGRSQEYRDQRAERIQKLIEKDLTELVRTAPKDTKLAP